MKNWLITGVSSGFGYEITKQLLNKGEKVIGTVRNAKKVESLIKQYPDTFDCKILDVTDTSSIHDMVKEIIKKYKKIDVVVSNAGYGLFGAAEELSDDEVNHIIATNLIGSIQLIRSVIPYMRREGYGRIIQLSSYGGQVAFPGNSMYHATKWGIEGFCESVAQKVAPFNIGMTIVEPGGARTEFRYGSAKVASLMNEYEGNPAHNFLTMLDPANGLAPGDPVKMATRIIEIVDINPAPLRIVLGAQALASTISTLKARLEDFESQVDVAASTDFILEE